MMVSFGMLVWAAGWLVNIFLAKHSLAGSTRFVAATIFGLTLLAMWELIVRGLQVPTVILPPPSMIAAKFATSQPTLWADFFQTCV